MKKSGFFSALVAMAVVILSLSGCNFFDDLLGNKDVGQYTSITFRITATYGGVNSEGTHKFTVNNNVLNNDYFVFNTTSGCNDTCSGAIYEDPVTMEITINSNTCSATQEYINWTYWTYNNNGTNCKCLVTSYEAAIIGYTYEEGQDDPGTPIISGLEQLEAFENCSGTFSTDCETTVTLNFSSPHSTGAQKSPTPVVAVGKQICSPGPTQE